MPSPRLQTYETFQGGVNRAVEPERLPPTQLRGSINTDIARDGLPEVAPGYAVDFELPKRRQIATMEDSEDSEWAGSATDESSTANFGFQSRKHVHTASDSAKTSTWTPPTDFLDFIKIEFQDKETTSGDVKFQLPFRSTDVSEILTIEVRFRKDGSNYFSENVFPPTTDDKWELWPVTFSAWTTVGALTWDEVVDVQIITTPKAANLAHDIMFDDFFIEDLTQSEPISGIHSFEVPIKGTRFLMVSTSDMIYSVVGTTPTKRDARLGRQRPVHMTVGNNFIFAVNDIDIPRRWDPDEPSFREAGVPAPPTGMTMAQITTSGGLVPPGKFSAKVTFDMGVHGEGNPSEQTATLTVDGDPDRAIRYAAVPIGVPGTVRRLIYRSARDIEGGPWFLDTIIDDNTTVTVDSLKSDADILASAQVQTDGAQPPVLKYIAEADSKLFGVPSTRPSRIRHSDITLQPNRTIEQWDVLNEMDNDPDDGDIITGLMKHKEFLYSFKRNSSYFTDPKNLSPQKISAIYGAISQRSVHDAGEKAYLWSARYGPMRLVGNRIDEIGKQLRDLEGRPLGITGVNENVLVPLTKTDVQTHHIDTKADWDLGTFDDLTSSVTIGSLRKDRGEIGLDFTQDLALASQGSTVSHALSGNMINVGDDPNTLINGLGTNVRPANVEGPRYFQSAGGNTGSAVVTVNLTQQKYKAIHLYCHRILNANFGSITIDLVGPGGTLRIGTWSSWASLPLTSGSANGHQQSLFEKSGTLYATASTNFEATKAVITLNMQGTATGGFSAGLTEVEAWRPALVRSGDWESQNIKVGGLATITSWGTFLADLSLNGSPINLDLPTVTFKMKSAATEGGLASANYQDVTNGTPPDPTLIPPNSWIKIKVFIAGQLIGDPEIRDITLSFNTLETEIIGTLVESNGIFYEDKAWFNLTKRDDDIPTVLWKIGFFEEGTEHDDYRMSCWAIHDGALMSGSAVDGKVYRNVRDKRGIRITSKDGRTITQEMQTGNNGLGQQSGEKSVRDWVLTARNENENFLNLIINGNFEEIASATGQRLQDLDPSLLASEVPVGWDQNAVNIGRTARLVGSKFDPVNVFSGHGSMELDASTLEPFEVFVSQKLNLINDTDYELELFSKNIGEPAEVQISTADGLILGVGGTWLSTNDPIQLADTGGIYAEQTIGFRTLTDIEDKLPVEVKFRYKATIVELQGRTFIDRVELRRAQTRNRKLQIIPILDGVDHLPVRLIDLVSGRDGIIRARGRIDKSGVRNLSYKIRTENLDTGFKFLTLLTSFGFERIRSAR